MLTGSGDCNNLILAAEEKMAHHNIGAFKIGEVIRGKAIIIEIREIREDEGVLVALVVGAIPGFSGRKYGVRIEFIPQVNFSESWASTDIRNRPLVLCVRRDGKKVLG